MPALRAGNGPWRRPISSFRHCTRTAPGSFHFSPFTFHLSLLLLLHLRQTLLDRVQRMFRIRTFGRYQNLGAGANIGGHDVHDADSGTKTAVCFQGDDTLETHGAADELTRRA